MRPPEGMEEASPLAGDVRPPVARASFGKLHLWRFPKEAEGRASSRSTGFLREASPLAERRRKVRPSFTKDGRVLI